MSRCPLSSHVAQLKYATDVRTDAKSTALAKQIPLGLHVLYYIIYCSTAFKPTSTAKPHFHG